MLDTITLLFKENAGAATIAAAIVSMIGMVVGALLDNVFQRSRLKKEQKVRFQDVIGEKIAEALIEIRGVAEEAALVKHVSTFKGGAESVDIMSGFCLACPQILTSGKALHAYYKKINSLRLSVNQYVDCETAAYLDYMETYLKQLMLYLQKCDMAMEQEPILGVLLSEDFINWQCRYDAHLVKKINSHKCKIYTHKGRIWERAVRNVRKELWTTSKLSELIQLYEEEQETVF